jgi:ABC-type Fe3+-hydroxamate transport system substrate-binding protein
MIEVVDATGRSLKLAKPAQRIVSLVPSETASVADLVGAQRLVGRTDYCVEPASVVHLPAVGGTKGFDVAAVEALRPDLVLANKEENSRPQVQGMIAGGLPVHVSFPCTIEESNQYLVSLCLLLGIDAAQSRVLKRCRDAAKEAREREPSALLPVFVPIWKDPWMTFDGRAYASDVLEASGAQNVFSGRSRRYPLAADLGKTSPWGPERVEDRDTRYPRIRLEEVVERGARAALLPDEPYAFDEEDVAALRDLGATPPLAAELVDGKDLFWYGTRVAGAIERLGARVDRLRSICFGS